ARWNPDGKCAAFPPRQRARRAAGEGVSETRRALAAGRVQRRSGQHLGATSALLRDMGSTCESLRLRAHAPTSNAAKPLPERDVLCPKYVDASKNKSNREYAK